MRSLLYTFICCFFSSSSSAHIYKYIFENIYYISLNNVLEGKRETKTERDSKWKRLWEKDRVYITVCITHRIFSSHTRVFQTVNLPLFKVQTPLSWTSASLPLSLSLYIYIYIYILSTNEFLISFLCTSSIYHLNVRMNEFLSSKNWPQKQRNIHI